MCIAGIKPEISKKVLWDFLMAATPYMSETDSHGVGYAATGRDGLWGERWLRPEDAWTYRRVWTEQDEQLKDNFKGTLEAVPRYNNFGASDPSNTSAVIFHTRMATCEKGLHNVHPFVRDNTALIHNGVIRNEHELKKITSTCDSECILNEYVEKNVSDSPEKISDVAYRLRGYYACGVLTQDKDKKNYLDIFRANGASLYAYYVKELDAVVFCTSSEIIRNACKDMQFSTGNTFKFKEEVMVRLNADTGEFVSQQKFVPLANWNGHGHYGNGNYYSGEHGGGGLTNVPTSDEKKSSLALIPNMAQNAIEQARSEMMDPSPEMSSKPCLKQPCTDKDTADQLADPFYYEGEGYGRCMH